MQKNRKTPRKHRKTQKVFNKNHYNSRDGMLTAVWGPSLWHSLHAVSFNYPVNPTEEEKQHYQEFVYNLRFVLPCGKCRENLCRNLKLLPLTIERMESRETFSKYIYHLHEKVNKMLGKKSGLTYEDVKERYEHFRARCISPKNKTMKTEKGCTEPVYGEKSKCVIRIVPQKKKCETFAVDERCLKKNVTAQKV
jgi:hypothetical protein